MCHNFGPWQGAELECFCTASATSHQQDHCPHRPATGMVLSVSLELLINTHYRWSWYRKASKETRKPSPPGLSSAATSRKDFGPPPSPAYRDICESTEGEQPRSVWSNEFNQSPSPRSMATWVFLGEPHSLWSMPTCLSGMFPLLIAAEVQSQAPGSCCSLRNFSQLHRLNKCLSREF